MLQEDARGQDDTATEQRRPKSSKHTEGGFIMDKQIRRIGVLTSGGDAPGMNALIRSVVPQRKRKRHFRSRHSPRLQRSYQRRHHRDGRPQCRRHHPQGRHHAVHRPLQGNDDRGRSAEGGRHLPVPGHRRPDLLRRRRYVPRRAGLSRARAFRASACRARSTTISSAPTTPSVSTPPAILRSSASISCATPCSLTSAALL